MEQAQPPSPTWMWKPRSKIQTGKKSAFSAFRNIGGQQWRRRYVCLDNGQFCYGKSKDELNKAIRLDTITGVARLSRSMLEAEKAPQSFLQFGWVLYSSDRRILFCCEDEPSVTSWVTFLEQHVTRDKNSMDKDQRNKRIMEDFLANDFGALAVGNDKNRPQTTDHPNPPYTAQPSSISVPSVDIKVDEDSSESDSTDDSAVSSVSSEEEEVAVDVSIDDASDLSQPPVPLTAAQEALVREASSTHVYLASQHAELSSHFRAVDTIADIVFSSTVEVFGQNEKWKTKKIAVARHHVYVFGKKGHLMMQDVVVKSLSMRKITGVLTSSSDDTLLAILLPTSHDKLLRFIPQKRDGEPVAAGTVCAQFRAHLFKIYYETLSTTVHRPFLMLGVHDIYKSIHANAEDRFPPLRASPLDSLEVSHSCDAVSRSLRAFADTDVFWSSAATDHTVKPVNVVFVITNTAVYTLDMQKSTVITRFPLDMMTSMYYCVSEGSIVFYAFSKKSQTLRIDPVSSKDVAFIAQAVGALLLELFTRDAKAEEVKELLPLVVVRSGEHPFALRVQEINLESSVREDTNAMATKNAFNWKNMRKEASKYLAQFNKGNAKKDVLAEVPQSTDVDSNEEVIKPVDAKASRTVQESLTEYGQFTSLLKSSAEQYTRWNQLNLAENSGDSFLLNKEPVAAGSIIFSCEAKLWSAKECHVWTKAMMNESPANQWSAKAYGSKCVFLITTEGIVLIASSADDVQKMLKRNAKVGVSWFSPWDDILGAVCHESVPLLALLSGGETPNDVAVCFRQTQVLQMARAAMVGVCFKAGKSTTHRKTRTLLPTYTTASPVQVALSLRRHGQEPPLVALRHGDGEGRHDWLQLSIKEKVVSLCRSYGDNTVHFSGLAWRMRSETLKKQTGIVGADPGPAMCRVNNHLFKSFVLLITNTALYYFTKGHFDLVRRTELSDLSQVYRTPEDMDTLLLTVPSEYDMYFRVPRRGEEFFHCLQNAYLEYTDFHWYRGGEVAHNREQYFLPTTYTSPIAPLGRLSKPINFNALQINRAPESGVARLQEWHHKHLTRALRLCHAASEAAQTGVSGRGATSGRVQFDVPSEDKGKQMTWADARQLLSDAFSRLRFVHDRAFRFGLNCDTEEMMRAAEELLEQYDGMQALVSELEEALRGENVEACKALLDRTRHFPELRLLTTGLTDAYNSFRERQNAAERIERYLRDTDDEMDSSSDPRALHSLVVAAFAEAGRRNVPYTQLVDLRLRYYAVVQQKCVSHLFFSPPDPATNRRVMRKYLTLPLLHAALTQLTAISPSEAGVELESYVTKSLSTSNASNRVKRQVELCRDALYWSTICGNKEYLTDVLNGFVLHFVPLLSGRVKQQSNDYDKSVLALMDTLQTEVRSSEKATHAVHAFSEVITRVQKLGKRVKGVGKKVNQMETSHFVSQGTPNGGGFSSADVSHCIVQLDSCEEECRQLQSTLNTTAGLSEACGFYLQKLHLYEDTLGRLRHFLLSQKAARENAVQAQETFEKKTERVKRRTTEYKEQLFQQETLENKKLFDEYVQLITKRCENYEVMLHEASQDTSGGHEEEHDARLNQLKQIVRLCYLLLQEVRDTVERYLPQVSDGEKEGVSSAGSTILHRLRQTADAAQQQIREQEQNSTSKRSYNRQVSNATFCSNYASDTFDHREGTPLADIPPRLKQLMDQLEEEQISLYIVEHKEEMTPTVLNAARQYYAGRKKMKASLLYLEAQLQTAIAIPNRALVAVYFQKAKALCYGDDAASGDQSWLQAFFENSEVFSAAKDLMDHPGNSTYSLEEGSVILNSSNSSATSESDSSSSSYDSDLNILSRESSPTANDTAVEKVNDFLETHLPPTTLNSRSIHTLREQLKEILVSPQRTIHFNESGGGILSFSLSIENDKLFRFVHLWCEVLTTNLKPMGVFRKVPLNLYHLCKIMGDMVSADDTLLCPIAGRVAALVERANFFGFPDDSPPVSTLDIIIVTHCLIGGRFLSMFLGETFKLQKSGHGRKVFLENSIYHYEEVILYIVRIAVFMEKYVEFPFKANTNEEKQSLMNFILQERVPEQSVPPAEPVLKQERPSVSVEKEKSVTTTTTTTTITPTDRVSQIVKELASCFSYTSNCMANRDSDDGTPVPSNYTAAFDETSPYSKIKQSMREVILPNLVFVLDKGLRPAAGVYTLWEVLRALQGAWQPEGTELEDVGAVHSPSVVSFLSLVELVQALTDEQGRNGKFLRSLSPAAVSTLRLKMFLRECLNRHQLVTMIELVFYGSGGLGKELFDIYAYYDPSSCVFSRENNVTEMIVLLKKISLFPFVLLQDSDMQGEAGATALR